MSADEWVELGTIHNAIGYSNEHIDIFLARRITEGGARELDEHEFIDVHKFSFEEALAMTRDGRITDVKTIIGLNWAQQYLEGKLPQAKKGKCAEPTTPNKAASSKKPAKAERKFPSSLSGLFRASSLFRRRLG